MGGKQRGTHSTNHFIEATIKHVNKLNMKRKTDSVSMATAGRAGHVRTARHRE